MNGRDGRDDGMRRADENAREVWKRICARCIEYLAVTQATVTTDDVWNALERWYPHITTHEPRALGPRMTAAVKAGLITPHVCPVCGHGSYVKSSRPVAHEGNMLVYDSLVQGRRDAG